MPPEQRLVGITLALEEALSREAWDEADDLFAARDRIIEALPCHAVPSEIDEIDARILARLRQGLAEIRRETLALGQGKRAASTYAGTMARPVLSSA